MPFFVKKLPAVVYYSYSSRPENPLADWKDFALSGRIKACYAAFRADLGKIYAELKEFAVLLYVERKKQRVLLYLRRLNDEIHWVWRQFFCKGPERKLWNACSGNSALF